VSENTRVDFLQQVCAGNDSAAGEFEYHYCNFLSACLNRRLYGGFKVCPVVYPHYDKLVVIEKLQPLIHEVCKEFIRTRLTPEFFSKYKEKLAESERTGKGKSSVRTVLQYTFVNALKKRALDFGVIFSIGKNNEIELYSREEGTGGKKLPLTNEDLFSLLRKFRIMLTRLAGKGRIDIYPSGYECYCLKFGCIDRLPYIERFVQDKQQQEKLKAKKILTDDEVSMILGKRYAGKTGVSCERKTINNRIKEYRERLKKTLLYHCRKLADNPALLKKVLGTSSTVPEDELLPLFHDFLSGFDDKQQAASVMKTRTVEL
jgi:hypothetical protein